MATKEISQHLTNTIPKAETKVFKTFIFFFCLLIVVNYYGTNQRGMKICTVQFGSSSVIFIRRVSIELKKKKQFYFKKSFVLSIQILKCKAILQSNTHKKCTSKFPKIERYLKREIITSVEVIGQALSPRILLANWISLGMMVTRFA